MKSEGASDALARTAAVNAITIGQVFYLLNSRYLLDSSLSLEAHMGNRYLPLGIGAVVVLQLLFTYATPFQAMFGNEAIPLWVWPWLLAGGLRVLPRRGSGKARSSVRRTPLRTAVTAVEAGLSVPPSGGGCGVQRPTLRLFAATDKMRSGAPGVTRERLETGDGVDTNDGFVGGQRSGRDRAERRAAVGEPQFAQCSCAFLQPY